MKYSFSVIVMTYHPIKSKLLSTLNSVVSQKNIPFEIIIADDGSPQFYQAEIIDFMEKKHFADYRILAHPQNQGTVKNLLDALEICQGKYVKVISPGDYLYCCHTLSEIHSFMEQHQAKILFSDMIYYSYEHKKLCTYPVTSPWDCSVYPMDGTYSPKKVFRHLTAYSDAICGASLFVEKNLFLEQLSRLRNTVIYAEDLTVQLLAFLGHRIWRYPAPGVWYEYGSGISTNGSLNFLPRIQKDFLNFTTWMNNTYPGNSSIRAALYIRRNLSDNRLKLIYLHRLLHWGEILFMRKKKMLAGKYTVPDHDEALFYEFHIEAAE